MNGARSECSIANQQWKYDEDSGSGKFEMENDCDAKQTNVCKMLLLIGSRAFDVFPSMDGDTSNVRTLRARLWWNPQR